MNKQVLDHFQKRDPKLHACAMRAGKIKLTPSTDYFAHLCESIINQQLSEKAGDTIFKRFEIELAGSITPENVVQYSDDKLRSCGISLAKVRYIKGLAHTIITKNFSLAKLVNLPDEQVIETLTKIKGIGRWTAEMFLMFSLGRPDVFSLGDSGIRRAIEKIYNMKNLSKKKIDKLTKKWAPFRTYACIILWRSLTV